MASSALQRGFLLLLVGAVSAAFLWMIRSFLVTVTLAAVFAGLIYPLYARLEKLFRGRRGAASAATLAIVFVLLIGPLASFFGIVAQQAVRVTQQVSPWVQNKLRDREALTRSLQGLPMADRLTPYIKRYNEQILERLGTVVSRVGNLMFTHITSLTAGTLAIILNLAIMFYAMFFFLIDGHSMLERLLYYMPLRHADEQRLLDTFRSMARATVKGTLVIGIVQGVGAGLALWAAGVPSALFWGTLMVPASIVPQVGTALIWGPAVAWLLIQGKILPGVLALLWCAVVVGSADNFLRPVLIGKDTKMHELTVLLTTLGGLMMFGLAGLILGPLLGALFFSVWDIYGAAFKDELPAVGKLG